jgi:hypothetical protein
MPNMGYHGLRSSHKRTGGIEGFRASIYRFPADRITVVILSNQERTDTDEISRQIARIVFGEP